MKTKNKKYLLLVLLVSLLTCARLFRPGYFSMQDDIHVLRLQQFDQCLKDGQIPCRYTASGGLGYGCPLYNYYSPLPYFVAEIFHLVGFSLINSLKILFILGHLLTGISMFLFASLYWGNLGGLLSSALFLFAPYRAIDGYVRGALAEFLGISLLPLIFYYLTQKKTKTCIIAISALLLTHNLTSLVTLPLIAIYVFLTNKYKIKSLFFLVVPFFLSAFFLLPAIFEKNLVTLPTMTQGYFDYRAHFTTLKQLFLDRSWGFGASLWGPVDDMSFQVGLPLWPLALLSLFFIYKQKKAKNKIILGLFSVTAIFALFLTHNKSTFIWTHLPFMAYFQFP
ncbi:hypothetical protein KJ909_02685, partial [Patescibacteria group bacterium]|nr:hypothetical protein [Patescibacteria group bacterium]